MSDKKKKVRWTPYATAALLDVWPRYAGQLSGNRKNQLVFCALSKKMQKRDVDVTPREVRSKINNMIQKYREEKRKLDSGCAPSDWKYFHTVDVIMKSYKSAKIKDEDEDEDEIDDEDNGAVLEKYLESAEISTVALVDALLPKHMFISESSPAESSSQCASNSPDEVATSSFSPFNVLKFRPMAQVVRPSSLFQAITSVSMSDIAEPCSQFKASPLSTHSSSDTSSARSMSTQGRKSSVRRRRKNRSIQWELLNELRNFNKIRANELKECRKASERMLQLEAQLFESTIQFQNEIM